VWLSLATALKAIRLDEAEYRLIGRNAAWSTAMPPGNFTQMSAGERATIADGVDARAP
jgi:uncharacterized membrane protein